MLEKASTNNLGATVTVQVAKSAGEISYVNLEFAARGDRGGQGCGVEGTQDGEQK